MLLAGVRIVLVNNFPGPGLGGGEVQLLPVVERALAEGAEVVAVVVPGSAFGRRVVALGGEAVEVPMSPRAFRAAVRAARAALADAAPAARVLIGTGYLTNLVARVAARGTGATLVNVAGVLPDAALADGSSRTGLALRRLADGATSAGVDAWVAVSGAVRDALVADGVPADRVRTIPNGIDVEAVRAGAAAAPPDGMPESRPLVAYVGRLERIKGADVLVRAATLVPDASFAVVGEGSQASALHALAAEESVADRVAFLPAGSAGLPVLAAADVVVVPSRSEAFGLVAAEASALGKAVVASRVGGLPEVVEDGVSGLLVPPGDPAALAGAIRLLLDDSERARAMGAAGARRVEGALTSRRMADAYVALFAELAEGRPAR